MAPTDLQGLADGRLGLRVPLGRSKRIPQGLKRMGDIRVTGEPGPQDLHRLGQVGGGLVGPACPVTVGGAPGRVRAGTVHDVEGLAEWSGRQEVEGLLEEARAFDRD